MNNKKIYMKTFIILFSVFILHVLPVAAQEKATSSATVQIEQDETIEKIKKIAENVVSKDAKDKAFSGTVFEIDNDELIVSGSDGRKVTVSLFITDFYQVGVSKFSEIKKEAIKKNDYVFVTGPQVGETITANAIYKDSSYFFITGKIATINKSDFSIDVLTIDKRQIIVDIESTTKQNMYNIKTKKSDKIGFSKLKEGDSVHIVVRGLISEITKDRVTANRLFVVPNEYFLQ